MDFRPVQAVVFIVKVQSHSRPKPRDRQLLDGPGRQVIAVDRFPHGVQDELILLCAKRQTYRNISVHLAGDGKGGDGEEHVRILFEPTMAPLYMSL